MEFWSTKSKLRQTEKSKNRRNEFSSKIFLVKQKKIILAKNSICAKKSIFDNKNEFFDENFTFF